MSLDNICNKITKDAQAEADKVANDSRAEIEKVLSEKDEELANDISRIKEEGRKKAVRLKDQAAFRLRTIEKNTILKTKQDAVDRVFAEAKESMSKVGDDEFVRIFGNALKSAPVLNGEVEAVFSRERKHLANKLFSAAGLKYALSDDFLPEGQEGVVLRSENIEISLTADALLYEARGELLGELMEILFNK